MNFSALILVGGFGKRLGSLTKKNPKPMLPIRNQPFLEHLLVHLNKNNFTNVTLAVSYLSEIIIKYFKNTRQKKIPSIHFSIEKKPLGTGGAIKQALGNINDENIFIINGDTYIDVDYKKMLSEHNKNESDITVASYMMREKINRYGFLGTNKSHQITHMIEKSEANEGLINAGVYILRVDKLRKILDDIEYEVFSFEKEILSNMSISVKKFHYQSEGIFCDIGIPEDYEKSQAKLFKDEK